MARTGWRIMDRSSLTGVVLRQDGSFDGAEAWLVTKRSCSGVVRGGNGTAVWVFDLDKEAVQVLIPVQSRIVLVDQAPLSIGSLHAGPRERV